MSSTPQPYPPALKIKTIDFSGHQSTALLPAADTSAMALLTALNLPDFPALLILIGSAGNLDQVLEPELNRLFNLGIAPAILESGAVVIDGGTDAGVMRLMGKSVGVRKGLMPLIGVSPDLMVTYPGMSHSATIQDQAPLEPHHSHFVLTAGTAWGDETATFFDLAAALLERDKVTRKPTRWPKQTVADPGKVKGLGLLIGGETVSRREMLCMVRMGIGVIVVGGSGGLADEITLALADRSITPADAEIAEITATGKLFIHQLKKDHDKGMQRLIIRELGMDNVLMRAWEVFADYDENAKLHQTRHLRIQFLMILLGVLSAAMAVCWQVAEYKQTPTDPHWHGFAWLLHTALLLAPILTTVFLTVTNKFKPGIKWFLLRAAAESLKSEIYAYRTRAAAYVLNAEQTLFEQVRIITQRTMRTEVNHSVLIPYDKTKGFPPCMLAASGQDDGFSLLSPDQYIRFRLDDQIRYYSKKTRTLDRDVRILYYLSFIVAGGATVLTVTEHQVWIAVTSAVIAGIGTYLGYSQLENTIVKYNQGRTDLESIKTWWMALSAEEQAKQENFDSLVKHTEQTVKSEIDGWVQQMQNSLAELNKAQEKQPDQAATSSKPAAKQSPTSVPEKVTPIKTDKKQKI
jgi:hypothetical protein